MFSIIGYCPVCGDPIIFMVGAHGRKKGYCSPNCAALAYNRRRAGKPIANPTRSQAVAHIDKRAKFLAERDQLWAENAAPVSTREVESNGTVYVVETRGAVRTAPSSPTRTQNSN